MWFTPSRYFLYFSKLSDFFGVFFQLKIFWEVCFCEQGFVHGSISMSLPYLPFTDKVSVEDRSLLSLCASSNCGLVFPIFLPEGQHEHISHISETPSLFFPSLAFSSCLHWVWLNIPLSTFIHQKEDCSMMCTHYMTFSHFHVQHA